MKRIILAIVGVLTVSVGAQAQTPEETIELAIEATLFRHGGDVTLITWNDVPPPAVPLAMLDPGAIGGPRSWGILRNQGDGFNASGAGGSRPQALWGRTVLYNRLHCSTSTVASGSV